MLVIGIIECIIITLNMYLGYKILGANDVGGAILIHTFGAYFGLAVSLALRNQKVELSFNLEEPRYTSDITSLLGISFQGYNARKVISEVYAPFVLQCTVSGR